MKVLKLILILMLALLQFKNASSQDYSRIIFGIEPTQKEFLRYFEYENLFDSARVQYTIGEFRINYNNNEERLNMQRSFDEKYKIQGSSIQGFDAILSNNSKTIPFTFPINSSVTFFRWLSANVPCHIQVPNDEPDQGGKGDWTDKYWHVGLNRIPDKSEFVIELVRKSDNTVLAVLDSVGVAQNPSSNIAQVYGTNPTRMNHAVNLPNQHAQTECFIRISPRRWGTTPYGMKLQVYPSQFSKSDIFEYDSVSYSVSKYGDNEEIGRIFDSIYVDRVFSYLDSVKLATGYLPDISNLAVINDNMQSEIISRYLYSEPIIAEHENQEYEFWMEVIDTSMEKRGSINDNSNDFADIQLTSKISTTSKTLKLQVKSNKSYENCQFNLYSLRGEYLDKLWSGNIPIGEFNIDFKVNDYYSGVYIIVAKDGFGKILGIMKVSIVY